MRLADPEIFENHAQFLKKSRNRTRFHWQWDTPEKYDANMRAYSRMLSGMDRVVGRVIQALHKQALAKHTVIVYSADNGYYLDERGFARKWSH